MDPNNPDHVQVINNAIALMEEKRFLNMDRFFVHGEFPELTRDEEHEATMTCGSPSCLGGYILAANIDRVDANDVTDVERNMGSIVSPLLGGKDFSQWYTGDADRQMATLFMPWRGLVYDTSHVDINDTYTPKINMRDYLRERYDLGNNDAYDLSELFMWQLVPVEAGIAVLEHFRDTGETDWRIGLDMLDLSKSAMCTARECLSGYVLIK